MSVLARCEALWGGTDVRAGSPSVERYRKALLLPWGSRPAEQCHDWGLFDEAGNLIELAAQRRDKARNLVGQCLSCDRAGIEAETMPRADYIFAGPAVTHYGHFVLTTLSRLWFYSASAKRDRRNAKLVFFSHGGSDNFLSHPFVAEVMGYLGIEADQITIPDRPVLFEDIAVPGPAFEEQSFAYHAYREFCVRVGHAAGVAASSGRAIYLSKSSVAGGNQRLAHQQELERAAHYFGFDVVHPEAMTIKEQIEVFSGNNTVVSEAGSALHTSVFAEGTSCIQALLPQCLLNSNFTLIDRLSDNRSEYVYPSAGFTENRQKDGFNYEFGLIGNPQKIAAELFERALSNHDWAQARTSPRRTTVPSLDEIGLAYGTDKASGQHGYLGFYQERLEPFRQRDFLFVEIGIYDGASLSMWTDYFEKAKIVGIDINPATKTHERLPRRAVKIADASRLETIDEVVAEHGRPLIVLDDGSHYWHHQIETLRYFWPKILPGGMFVMEDVHTSFEVLAKDWKGHSDISTYDYLLRLNRWVVGHDVLGSEVPTDGFISNYWSTIRSIEWHRHTAILYKK